MSNRTGPVLALIAGLAVMSFADESAGVLISPTRGTTIQTEIGEDRAVDGRILTAGEILCTPADGGAGAILSDTSFLAVGPSSRLFIGIVAAPASSGSSASRLLLSKGNLRLERKRADELSPLEIATINGTITVAAGEVYVEWLPPLVTRAAVISGSALVAGEPGGRPQRVRAGAEIRIEGLRAPTVSRITSPEIRARAERLPLPGRTGEYRPAGADAAAPLLIDVPLAPDPPLPNPESIADAPPAEEPGESPIGTWTVTFGLTGQYDDNVSLTPPDADTGTDQEDWKTVATLSLKYRRPLTDDWSGSARYAFYQSLHTDLGAFDIQSHGLTLSAIRTGRPFIFHIPLGSSYYTLDDETYLTTIDLSPTLFWIQNDRTLGIFQYRLRQQEYATPGADPKDGVENSIGAREWFLFGEDRDRRLEAGYRFNWEMTEDDDYEYFGHLLSVGTRLPLVTEYTLDADLSYLVRNYRGQNSTYGVEQADGKLTLSLSVERPVLDWLSASLRYTSIDNASNISDREYLRNVYSIGLEAGF